MTDRQSSINEHAEPGIYQRFRQDHERVLGLAGTLKSLLNGPVPRDIQELVSARWAFASALMQALAIKERHIYAKLEHDPRSAVTTFFKRSKADLQTRFDAYADHMQEWPTDRAVNDWAAYRPRAIFVVDAFIQRLRWEDNELFAFVKANAIDIALPAPATSNWVRKAFDVKSSVEKQ